MKNQIKKTVKSSPKTGIEKKGEEVDQYGWTEAARDDPIYQESVTIVFNPSKPTADKTDKKVISE